MAERLAQLAVAFGANVQRGQIVAVHAEPSHAELVHAVAEACYRRGARFVDVCYFDPFVKRARLRCADTGTLEFVPSWYRQRIVELGEQRCALITITGPTAPALFDDLEPARVGRDLLPHVKETVKLLTDRTTNWTMIPFPTPGWAYCVHPDLDPDDATARLATEIEHVCRLDDDDPVAAWEARMHTTHAAAAHLNALHADALHFEGPGTDLTVGLLPTSTWFDNRLVTVDGIAHHPNLPSEEVFTTPDPRRTEGTVSVTRPLVVAGSMIRGLELRFESGRVVDISADERAEVLRAICAKSETRTRLGEVALVDADSRVGRLGTIFHNTLLDENGASHLALGNAFDFAVDARDRPVVNRSDVHIDLPVGGDGVSVTAITRSGREVPVLRAGRWRLDAPSSGDRSAA
jgi:aminopeptidase